MVKKCGEQMRGERIKTLIKDVLCFAAKCVQKSPRTAIGTDHDKQNYFPLFKDE